MTIKWQWCGLDELSSTQAYKVFAARSTVFVIEQNCVYQDLDGLDLQALHLVGWSGAERSLSRRAPKYAPSSVAVAHKASQ